MPRSNFIRDTNRERREILFGSNANPVSLKTLGRRTDIPERTLRQYRDDPKTIPLGRLSKIVRARGLGEEELYQLIIAR